MESSGRHCPGSRAGLLQSELLELLAPPGHKRRAINRWARLHRSLGLYLKPRAAVGGGDEGLINFINPQLVKVVRQRYLDVQGSQWACRQK